MLNGADASFLQHVITDMAENIKLFNPSQFTFKRGFGNKLGELLFEHWVGFLDYSVIIQQRTVDLRPLVPLQYLSHAALRSLCNGH